MMKKVVYILLLILALALQDTWLPKIAVFGAKPDFLLFFVVFTSIFYKPRLALLIGAAIGLCEDILLGRYIGFNLICFAITGYLISYLGIKFYKDNYLIPIISILAGTFVAGFSGIIVSYLIGLDLPFWRTLLTGILPDSIYNSILAPIIYIPVYLFFIEYKKKKV